MFNYVLTMFNYVKLRLTTFNYVKLRLTMWKLNPVSSLGHTPRGFRYSRVSNLQQEKPPPSYRT